MITQTNARVPGEIDQGRPVKELIDGSLAPQETQDISTSYFGSAFRSSYVPTYCFKESYRSELSIQIFK